MFISCEKNPRKWENFTLIVPSVSVGNVGQLATDLIISTLYMEKVGYLYHDSILPLVGNDPFAAGDLHKHCSLTTAAEVFYSGDKQLVAIQQRAPFVKGRRGQFVSWLVNWIKECKFGKVFMLSSSHAHERLDKQMSGTQLRCVLSPKLDQDIGAAVHGSYKWVDLERRSRYGELGSEDDEDELFIPGGGIAKTLYQACCDADLSVGILLKFCAEGDNASDAAQLATYVNQCHDWVDLQKSAQVLVGHLGGWKPPSSWKLQYGSTFQQSLYW